VSGLVPLYRTALRCAILQLPRRAGVAESNLDSPALVPLHACRAQESVGRFFSGGCRRVYCLEACESRAVVEKAPSSVMVPDVYGRPCAVRLCWWTATCRLSSKKAGLHSRAIRC